MDRSLEELAQKYKLHKKQLDQFAQYLTLLQEWNQRINLTAITKAQAIVSHHFDDSLQLVNCMHVSSIQALADIGTGAGFPGLALKIMYPHLRVLLIEVNHKKIKFLHAVIDQLGLENVQTCDLDWRTFLRTTEGDIDLFVSRAALQPSELLRMFKPASHYNKAQLVYWASGQWQPTEQEAAFVVQECPYILDNKQRKLVLFKKAY